jgi:hypothetical protein
MKKSELPLPPVEGPSRDMNVKKKPKKHLASLVDVASMPAEEARERL